MNNFTVVFRCFNWHAHVLWKTTQKNHIEFKEIQHLMDCTYHLLDCVPLKEGWPGSGWVRLHAPVCECGSFSVEPWISGFCFGASSLKLGFVLCKIQTLKKVNTLLIQGFFTFIFSFCHSVFLLQWFMSTLKIHRFILFMYSYFNLCGFHFD